MFRKSVRHVYFTLSKMGLLGWIPDKTYLKMAFYLKLGSHLNIDHPITYNEKIQWLKLHDRKDLYIDLVDKYKVREYVASIIGKEYLVPLLGKWDCADDIDFDKLPKSFVLKCNHDSGSVIVCTDKNKLDYDLVRKKLNKHLNEGTFSYGREWPYKAVRPCIIAEEYLEDSATGELRDYKFFSFDGVVKAMFIATDRQRKDKPTAFDFYDPSFHHLDIKHGHPNADIPPEEPQHFKLMIDLAEKLSKGMPHVRVDFYEVNGKVYFGEITFYHHSGFTRFVPDKWDRVFGDWINLPTEEEEQEAI